MRDLEAKRKYQREWLRKRRSDFFKDKECINCGTVENLQLDHIDPKTKVTHRIWSWSKQRRDTEIAKCQVLCAVCHLEKSKTNGDLAQGSRSNENNGSAKLTNAIVLQLRALYATGHYTHVQLAEMFDIPRSTVGHAIRGKDKWKTL